MEGWVDSRLFVEAAVIVCQEKSCRGSLMEERQVEVERGEWRDLRGSS